MRKKKKPLQLDRRAEEEVESATDYYEGERRGLGAVFHAAVLATLGRIAAFPAAFSSVMTTRGGHAVRRAIIHPFAYKVVQSSYRRRSGLWR